MIERNSGLRESPHKPLLWQLFRSDTRRSLYSVCAGDRSICSQAACLGMFSCLVGFTASKIDLEVLEMRNLYSYVRRIFVLASVHVRSFHEGCSTSVWVRQWAQCRLLLCINLPCGGCLLWSVAFLGCVIVVITGIHLAAEGVCLRCGNPLSSVLLVKSVNTTQRYLGPACSLLHETILASVLGGLNVAPADSDRRSVGALTALRFLLQ